MPPGPALVALILGAIVGSWGPLAGQEAAGQEAAGQEVAEQEVAGRTREVPISLEEAERSALDHGLLPAVADARARAAASGSRSARASLYPGATLEFGALRSSDPVAVFGTRLRQQRFGASDLALPTLNDPDPVTDWTGGLRVAWRGLDPAVWATARAAARDAEAAGRRSRHAREVTLFQVRRAYLRAVQGEARLREAEAAAEAARATRDRFRRRFEEGLLTRADLLEAEAEMASAEAARLRTRQKRDAARRGLALELGWAPDSIPVPSDPLPALPRDSDPASPVVEGDAVMSGDFRSDLQAGALEVEAAASRLASARHGWLPSIEAFGGYITHAADPFASDGPEWTAGVVARWAMFDGGGRSARIGRAGAELAAARVRQEHARRVATLEVEDARDAVLSALAAARASALAAEAAVAGRDLMRRRFEEGLAGPADLLQAEARAAAMRRGSVDATVDYRIALARLEFVTGTPPEPRTPDRAGEETSR